MHVHGISGEANDVEDFFVGLLDLLSDERWCYLLICWLHKSQVSESPTRAGAPNY